MADALDRTSLELLKSINTPDYSTVNYVINPDLSPVNGVPKKYWKLTGDTLSEMTQSEKDAVDAANLAAHKTLKFAAIDERTEELIAQGFTYATKQFSLSAGAQMKMVGTHQIKGDPNLTYPISWNTLDDNDVYNIVDAEDLCSFYLTGVATLRACLDSGTSLKGQIRAATTIAAVDAVVDNR